MGPYLSFLPGHGEGPSAQVGRTGPEGEGQVVLRAGYRHVEHSRGAVLQTPGGTAHQLYNEHLQIGEERFCAMCFFPVFR